MTVDPKRELARELYLQGKKYQEIADEVGVSLSAVKSWATRYWRPEKLQPGSKKLQPKLQRKLQPKNTAAASLAITTQPVHREISMPSSTAFFVSLCRRRRWNWSKACRYWIRWM